MVEQNQWRCPSCGTIVEKQSPSSAVAGDMATCPACGTTVPQSLVDAGKFTVGAAATQPARGRNPVALVAVAIVAAAMLYFGFHMARRSGSTGVLLVTKASVAPDFTLESLEGTNLRLADLRGKAVLLNFWATWCGPCKIEMPWFVELQKQYGPQGLQIVGVAMDDASKDDIAKFAKEMGVNYPVLLGKEAVGDAYGGVPALPESFFIGRDGKIVDKIIGLKGKGEIEDSIKKALSTEASSSQTARSSAPATQTTN